MTKKLLLNRKFNFAAASLRHPARSLWIKEHIYSYYPETTDNALITIVIFRDQNETSRHDCTQIFNEKVESYTSFREVFNLHWLSGNDSFDSFENLFSLFFQETEMRGRKIPLHIWKQDFSFHPGAAN